MTGITATHFRQLGGNPATSTPKQRWCQCEWHVNNLILLIISKPRSQAYRQCATMNPSPYARLAVIYVYFQCKLLDSQGRLILQYMYYIIIYFIYTCFIFVYRFSVNNCSKCTLFTIINKIYIFTRMQCTRYSRHQPTIMN